MKSQPRIERPPFGEVIVTPGLVGPPDDEDMLNANQVAEFLNVSVHKVSRLVRMGHLPPYVSSVDKRHRLFNRTDLERLLPDVADLGNDWEEPSADTDQARDAVYGRLFQREVLPGPNGYDLQSLVDAVERRGWVWRVEKEMGPWRFDESKRPTYEAVVDRPYRPGLGGMSVTSHALAPELALARSLDRLLDNEAKGESLLD